MISGITLTALYIIYFQFINPAANTPDNWWFGISPEGIGTPGMILNFAVATAVARFPSDAPKDVREMVAHIRFPKGAGEASAH